MSNVYIASLNSGSNGNCFYIGDDREAILVDAGLSCKETEIRMRRLGLDMRKVGAILVSHEHSDHIKGIPVLAQKYRLPVYLTERTFLGARLRLDGDRIVCFQAGDRLEIGPFSVFSFAKRHDAADPVSFRIAVHGRHIGVFTDLGSVCPALAHHFAHCHAAFLEANYDADMLDKGGYPYMLKQRIRGGHGHLSNEQALRLFIDHKPAHMSHLLLSHLSKDNNCPELALSLFRAHAGQVEIGHASRWEESALLCIGEPLPARPVTKQMELFGL